MHEDVQTLNGRGATDPSRVVLHPPERRWTFDEVTAEDRPADFATGLISLAFVRAAVRRGARLWCATAIVGMLLGSVWYLMAPPAYEASASVLLTPGPYENGTTAALDDQAIATSRAVAAPVVHRLGLRQSVDSFLATYRVAVISNRVLLITLSAPSGQEAVRRANAVATAFLSFRASELNDEQNLVLNSLQQQINQAKGHLNSVDQQITELSTQPASPAHSTELKKLQDEQNQAESTVYTLEQSANGGQVPTATALAVKGSEVLDTATAVAPSRVKRMLLYCVAGLVLGLALGLGIVVLRAITSDRLRRRDDVAHALGAPVQLSVKGAPRRRLLRRRRRARRGRRHLRDEDVQRIVAHLHNAVPARRRSPAALAVVPSDDPDVAAQSVVSLAVACAREGKTVVVADLCSDAPAARLLGQFDAGVHPVTVTDAQLVVAVPDRDEVLPGGPLEAPSQQAQPSAFKEAVAAACASADVLLTLVALDPSLGSEHLATWATDVVVMVTAGRSSWTRIQAVGEMVRLSDARLVSAVLVGADKADDSLGVADAPKLPVTPVPSS